MMLIARDEMILAVIEGNLLSMVAFVAVAVLCGMAMGTWRAIGLHWPKWRG